MFFTLKKVGERIEMRTMRGILHCDEWFLNDKGEKPSIPGMPKIQNNVGNNNKTKSKVADTTEQDDMNEVPKK